MALCSFGVAASADAATYVVMAKANAFDMQLARKVEAAGGPLPASGDDDAFFDLQWGHAAVDAAGAWNQGYRGQGAIVAVLDSGIACQHADIAPNLLLSESTSFVTGEGVCLSHFGFNHGSPTAILASPRWRSPFSVIRILRASADDLGKPDNDDFNGAGRVNASRAVTY